MSKARKNREELLTPMQLKFVGAWAGDNTAAARKAGYRQPKQAAAKLMKVPAIREAIAEKQAAAVSAAGKKLGRTITKIDVVERLLRLADIPISKTRGNMSGQVSALKSIAEIQGYVLSKNLNYFAMFDGKSEEELEYFALHGYWPTVPDPGPESVQ
jgi:hypothetical protein